MKPNECFYSRDACGIMVDGDDDVRLHWRDSCGDPDAIDQTQREAAEVHLLHSCERESNGNVTDFGRDGSKLGWAPLADDGMPGGGIYEDATRHPPIAEIRGQQWSAQGQST